MCCAHEHFPIVIMLMPAITGIQQPRCNFVASLAPLATMHHTQFVLMSTEHVGFIYILSSI